MKNGWKNFTDRLQPHPSDQKVYEKHNIFTLNYKDGPMWKDTKEYYSRGNNYLNLR